MKKMICLLSFILVAATLTGFSAEAKMSKKEKQSIEAECKSENPSASKKEIRKCVKRKIRK